MFTKTALLIEYHLLELYMIQHAQKRLVSQFIKQLKRKIEKAVGITTPTAFNLKDVYPQKLLRI